MIERLFDDSGPRTLERMLSVARHAPASACSPDQGCPTRVGVPTTLVMRLRLLLVVCCLTAGLAVPATAGASQLIARDAKNVRLQVNAKGEALLTYTAKGKQLKVLAWGAVDAVHPTPGARQTAFKLDYAGGWGKYRKVLSAATFKNVCRPYTGPALPWLLTACTAPDGSHWALQSWQRALPNLGLAPWLPLQSAAELHLSHWTTDIAKLELWANWAYSKRFDHVFGRLTYRGQPVFGFASTRKGEPLDAFGRNIYLDTLDSAYGPGWKRENSFLTHIRTGAFCYGFYEHDPYPGYPAVGRRPQGKGTRYRATVLGPGVTPIVSWEGPALGAYDAALDAQLRETQREVYAGDALCKPL